MEFKCGTVWQERARVHGIDSKEKAASSRPVIIHLSSFVFQFGRCHIQFRTHYELPFPNEGWHIIPHNVRSSAWFLLLHPQGDHSLVVPLCSIPQCIDLGEEEYLLCSWALIVQHHSLFVCPARWLPAWGNMRGWTHLNTPRSAAEMECVEDEMRVCVLRRTGWRKVSRRGQEIARAVKGIL